MKPVSYVYFIKPVGMDGPIKIGCSNTPETRLIALAAWSPFPLEIIGRTRGTQKDEAFLHSCFSDLHTHHEWFHFSPALRETINKILATSIDEVRCDLTPKSKIRKGRPLKSERSASESLRVKLQCQLNATGKRLRKQDENGAWYVPLDVRKIMEKWHGNPYRKVAGTHPTDAEIARVQECADDPTTHFVVPYWKMPKDPICIPIFGEAEAV